MRDEKTGGSTCRTSHALPTLVLGLNLDIPKGSINSIVMLDPTLSWPYLGQHDRHLVRPIQSFQSFQTSSGRLIISSDISIGFGWTQPLESGFIKWKFQKVSPQKVRSGHSHSRRRSISMGYWAMEKIDWTARLFPLDGLDLTIADQLVLQSDQIRRVKRLIWPSIFHGAVQHIISRPSP